MLAIGMQKNLVSLALCHSTFPVRISPHIELQIFRFFLLPYSHNISASNRQLSSGVFRIVYFISINILFLRICCCYLFHRLLLLQIVSVFIFVFVFALAFVLLQIFLKGALDAGKCECIEYKIQVGRVVLFEGLAMQILSQISQRGIYLLFIYF